MDLAAIQALAAPHFLEIFGAFHATPEDDCPPGTMVLLAPLEPGFWGHVTGEPEFIDGAPDPLDRWSSRVIGALGSQTGGSTHFPFGGPPYAPFIRWATRTGRAWPAPVGMLVHDTAGLMISIRGAILLPDLLEAWGRHMMNWLHIYLPDGFAPLHREWRATGDGLGETVTYPEEGTFIGLDENGGMILKAGETTRILSLADHLVR